MQLSVYHYFAKLFSGIGKFLFWFFFLLATVGITLSYKTTGCLLYFFTIYNKNKLMQNYPWGAWKMSWLCLVCLLVHLLTKCASFALYKKTNLPLSQLPFKHLYIAFGSTLHPKKASIKMSLVRFIMLNSHLFSILWSVDKLVWLN